MPDHARFTMALLQAADFHVMILLELAVNYWQWWGLSLSHGLRHDHNGNKKTELQDASPELLDLGLAVRTRVAGIDYKVRDRALLDPGDESLPNRLGVGLAETRFAHHRLVDPTLIHRPDAGSGHCVGDLFGSIHSRPMLGGLHYHYVRV